MHQWVGTASISMTIATWDLSSCQAYRSRANARAAAVGPVWRSGVNTPSAGDLVEFAYRAGVHRSLANISPRRRMLESSIIQSCRTDYHGTRITLRPERRGAGTASSLALLRWQRPRDARAARRLAGADARRARGAGLPVCTLPRLARRRHGHAGRPERYFHLLVFQCRPDLRFPRLDRHAADRRTVVHAAGAVVR